MKKHDKIGYNDKQSRSVCVKCRRDGELPGGRKGVCLAVRRSHPAVLLIYADIFDTP